MPKKTRQQCIRSLDKSVSTIVRIRDSDNNGYISCVSCRKKVFWKEAHCCHFIERAVKSLRFDFRNVHAGCVSCNVYRQEFHKREYTIFMIDTYGRDLVDNFRSEKHKISIIPLPTLRGLEKEMREKAKEHIEISKKRQK